MPRAVPRRSDTPGPRRSNRLINKANGAVGSTTRRVRDRSPSTEPAPASTGQERPAPKSTPGSRKEKPEMKKTGGRKSATKQTRNSGRKTAATKAGNSGQRLKARVEKTPTENKTPTKAKRARKSQEKSDAGSPAKGTSVREPKRKSRQPAKRKSDKNEICEDVGDVKPGGFVSALGKRKTPWEVNTSEAHARRQRAMQHRLFLVGRRDSAEDLASDNLTYIVMGTTGNIYYCTLTSKAIKCTCVDQRVRKVFCKHLLFVMFKVLKIPDTHHVSQRKYAEMTPEELAEIYSMSRQNLPDDGAVAPESVRKAYHSVTGQAPILDDQKAAKPAPQREISSDDDCPICFETLDNGEPLEYCKESCGRSVHAECFGKWAASKKRAGEPVTCVYCRQPWTTEQVGDDRQIKRKRLNLESYVEA